jgi:SHAQKYF class myb-like DNA-binding protein
MQLGSDPSPVRARDVTEVAGEDSPDNAVYTKTLMKTTGKPNAFGGVQNGRWTTREHDAFIVGLNKYGREWKKVSAHIQTRTSAQIRSHAQKYFAKLNKDINGNPLNAGGSGQRVQAWDDNRRPFSPSAMNIATADPNRPHPAQSAGGGTQIHLAAASKLGQGVPFKQGDKLAPPAIALHAHTNLALFNPTKVSRMSRAARYRIGSGCSTRALLSPCPELRRRRRCIRSQIRINRNNSKQLLSQ